MGWLLLVALAASASPVEAARAHLEKGQLDDVLFDLEGKKLSAAEQPEAVKVLAQTSRASLAAKDAVMALHLASMALKLDARSAVALEAASRAAFAQQLFEDAERHCDAWLAVEPKSQAARMLRAELAAEAGEWPRVLEQLTAAKLETPQAKALEARAKKELTEREGAMTALAAVTKAVEAQARKPVKAEAVRREAPASSGTVVVYGTAWCGYCKKARSYLTAKGISFVDRDIEQDPGAADELALKARAAGVTPTGVPVIDVKGKLILGFSAEAIDRAL